MNTDATSKTAVLYARVSTLEQSNKRYSIESQKTYMSQFCETNDIKVLAAFQDAATGTNFNRDGFNQLKEYCKKKKPTYILIFRWDRLGRNAVEMLTTVREFQKLGIEINAVEQWKEGNNADSMFLLGLQAILAERESAVTSERIRSNILKANEQGIWLNKLPLGYRRSNILDAKGKRAVEVCPVGEVIVKEIFELFVAGFDKMKIRDLVKEKYKAELVQLKYPFAAMAIRRILTNIFYIGNIHYKDSNNIEQITKGIHTPIIDSETFEKAQKRMELLEGVHNRSEHVERDEYPLKSLVLCPECHIPLRAYKVKKVLKKSGELRFTHYYDCKHNHFRIQVKDAHAVVSSAITDLSFSKNQLDEIHNDILKINQAHNLVKNRQLGESAKIIQEAAEKIRKLDDLLMNGLSISDYNRMKKQYETVIEDAELSVATVADFVDVQKNITKKVVSIILEMDSLYERANGAMKKRLLKAMFPEGFYISKTDKIVLTRFINSFFAVIHSKSNTYKKIRLLEADGLSLGSPNGNKIEPKKPTIAYEMQLINAIFA